MESQTFQNLADTLPKSVILEINKSQKTDDIEFAERELFNIKKREKRKEENRVKIWQQSSNPEAEKDINIRNKITELKKKCRENHGFSDVDLRSQKFLTKIDVSSIMDSRKIISDTNKPTNNKGKNKIDSIFNFVEDNREISMKNFLLDLLKDERSSINSKEFTVTKALKDSEVRMDKDYKNFIDFVEEEKKTHKLNEQKIIENYNNNRELGIAKKKLNQENKTIVDDLDRTVKAINNLKSNAAFVHLVLGGIFRFYILNIQFFNKNFFITKIKFILNLKIIF